MELTVVSGRLVGDLELKKSDSGKTFAVGTIAVYQGKTQDGKEKPSKYFNVIQFFSEEPKHLTNYTKGSLVSCQGTVEAEIYMPKDNSEPRTSLKLTCTKINLEHHYKSDVQNIPVTGE